MWTGSSENGGKEGKFRVNALVPDPRATDECVGNDLGPLVTRGGVEPDLGMGWMQWGRQKQQEPKEFRRNHNRHRSHATKDGAA